MDRKYARKSTKNAVVLKKRWKIVARESECVSAGERAVRMLLVVGAIMAGGFRIEILEASVEGCVIPDIFFLV